MKNRYAQAKEIFLRYDGSCFQMDREGEYACYKKYHVPKKVEIQWFNEILDEILFKINCDTNNKNIGNEISRYCSILCNKRNFRKLKPLIQYIIEHASRLDTFTLCLSIERIFDVIAEMQKLVFYRKKCCLIASDMLSVLKEALENGVIVSKDYAVEGQIPHYLATDILMSRILTDIETWKTKYNLDTTDQ